MTIQPPDPITDPSDLTLRFAVGDADGLRSTTWSVVLQKNSGDVFIGARSQMGDTKLSLHRSGTWRLAFTEQSGRQTETGDRVIARYQPPPPVGDGWRRGTSILIPHSSLRPTFPEKTRAKAPISWWPTPGPGRGLRFEILLREPDPVTGGLTVNQASGEVGRMQLPDGLGVWIVANDVPSDAAHEAFLDEIRDEVRGRATEVIGGMPFPTAMAWGTDDADGVPTLYDLGDPTFTS